MLICKINVNVSVIDVKIIMYAGCVSQKYSHTADDHVSSYDVMLMYMC